MLESKVDVLVVGAGPSGLMCANGLARAGVNVRIVDKRAQKVVTGHGDGIQPRTVEVLQSYGLADRILKEAVQVHMAVFYNPGPNGGIERTQRARDVTAPTARYPFEMALNQGAIESIFVDSMREMKMEVDRPTIPTSIELSTDEAELKDPQSYPIKVVLKHMDDNLSETHSEIIRAKYVVGADGAHSWVRKSFGITMDGEQTEYIWGVLDMVPDTDFPDIRNRTAIHSDNGSCMVIPREGDLIRVYIQLSDQEFKNVTSGRLDASKCSAEKLLEVAQRSFYPYTIKPAKEVEWWTIYIIGQRIASKYSVYDRVLIAGDACHTHSPKAGQGMNASMNDTHNLIWKLAYVLRGWAGTTLLKTYEFERRKYAQDLLDFDKKFATLFSSKTRTEDSEDGITHEEFMGAWQKFSSFTTGVGVKYEESPITNVKHQSCAPNIVVGERMRPQMLIRVADAWPHEIQDVLPADTRYKIIIFTGDIVDPAQNEKILALTRELDQPDSFFRKYTPKDADQYAVFDILTISIGKKEEISFTDIPQLLRPHWTRVFVDDVDFTGKIGGNAYNYYGVDKGGAIAVVRPDGYVGIVTPFNKVKELDSYFSTFLTAWS